MARQGIHDRQRYGWLCGEVNDRVALTDQFVDGVPAEDGFLDYLDRKRLDVGDASGTKIIEHRDAFDFWPRKKLAAQICTDEAGSAGYQDLHFLTPAQTGSYRVFSTAKITLFR